LTAVAVGLVAFRAQNWMRILFGMLLGAAITIAGYALATYIMYGYAAVLPETYFNIAQTGLGIVVGFALLAWNRTRMEEMVERAE